MEERAIEKESTYSWYLSKFLQNVPWLYNVMCTLAWFQKKISLLGYIIHVD